jgi:hypothetical protein
MVADILDFTSESKQIQKRTIQKTIDYERESLNSDDQQFHQLIYDLVWDRYMLTFKCMSVFREEFKNIFLSP